ncbi:DUF2946 domain-containing protein [Pseudomonas defluvii]|uniref:DUF2946 domain-containing protein n=1 Tax=Pseudomonas defluvii TaxID=1876757 RepID=UPI003906BCF0
MNQSPSHRPFIAWALYFCVLFNVLSCGLVHGQALGLALNGFGGGFCSQGGETSALQAKQDGALAGVDGNSPFACPMCSAVLLTLVFLLGVAWLLATANSRPLAREVRSQAPPRYCWPSSNPRASPL